MLRGYHPEPEWWNWINALAMHAERAAERAVGSVMDTIHGVIAYWF